jgi:hypothetical protein
MQKQNADLQRQYEASQAQIASLNALVSSGRGQGTVKRDAQAGPQSLAARLAKSGELRAFVEMAEDPQIGLEGAFYALTETLEKHQAEALDRLRSEAIEPITTRAAQERGVANAIGAAQRLASSGFPELDDSNHSPEAEEAQSEILAILQDTFSPEQIAQNPERTLRTAVLEYRHLHGTPVFAVAPGTSGSPSARAAAAAEAAAAAATPVPLDGTGTPRPRMGGPEGPQDRLRRENRALASREATTPSGRKLGFDAA